MTQQQATELERAIQIAKDHHHKVFTATHNLSGATVYTVRSHSDQNLFHVLYIQAGRIHCDCQRSTSGHVCSHAAAVRLFLIAQRDALASVEQREEQEREAERQPDIGACACGQPATQLNGLVQSDHLDEPMCAACYEADNRTVQLQVARMQAERLASLQRTLAAVETSEERKLEAYEAQEAARNEPVCPKCHRYPSYCWCQQAERAARRERALPYSEPEKEFSIFRSSK